MEEQSYVKKYIVKVFFSKSQFVSVVIKVLLNSFFKAYFTFGTLL